MDFESAMQTFAEAWMAANKTGKVVFGRETIEKNTKNGAEDEAEKTEPDKVSFKIIYIYLHLFIILNSYSIFCCNDAFLILMGISYRARTAPNQQVYQTQTPNYGTSNRTIF